MTTMTISEQVLLSINVVLEAQEYDLLVDYHEDDFIAITVSLVNIEIDIRLEGDNGEDKGLHIHVGGLDDDTILFDGVFYTDNDVDQETQRLYKMVRAFADMWD
jgi:hypothetical protein